MQLGVIAVRVTRIVRRECDAAATSLSTLQRRRLTGAERPRCSIVDFAPSIEPSLPQISAPLGFLRVAADTWRDDSWLSLFLFLARARHEKVHSYRASSTSIRWLSNARMSDASVDRFSAIATLNKLARAIEAELNM